MLFKLSDGATLAAFHHNRHHDLDYTGLSGTKPELMADRSELWVSLSGDGGRSWSEPRFLLANALQPAFDTPFRNHQCSYMDLFIDRGTIHLFIPHRWQQGHLPPLPGEPAAATPHRFSLLKSGYPEQRAGGRRPVNCAGSGSPGWRGRRDR